MNQGYNRTNTDHRVFVKNFSDGDFVILLLYVDDTLIAGWDTNKIEKLKRELNKFFAIKDLEPTKQILGMKITRDRASKIVVVSRKLHWESTWQI